MTGTSVIAKRVSKLTAEYVRLLVCLNHDVYIMQGCWYCRTAGCIMQEVREGMKDVDHANYVCKTMEEDVHTV